MDGWEEDEQIYGLVIILVPITRLIGESLYKPQFPTTQQPSLFHGSSLGGRGSIASRWWCKPLIPAHGRQRKPAKTSNRDDPTAWVSARDNRFRLCLEMW